MPRSWHGGGPHGRSLLGTDARTTRGSLQELFGKAPEVSGEGPSRRRKDQISPTSSPLRERTSGLPPAPYGTGFGLKRNSGAKSRTLGENPPPVVGGSLPKPQSRTSRNPHGTDWKVDYEERSEDVPQPRRPARNQSPPPGVRPGDGLSTTPLQNWLDYPFITALPMTGLSTGCPRNFPYSQAALRAEVRP